MSKPQLTICVLQIHFSAGSAWAPEEQGSLEDRQLHLALSAEVEQVGLHRECFKMDYVRDFKKCLLQSEFQKEPSR